MAAQIGDRRTADLTRLITLRSGMIDDPTFSAGLKLTIAEKVHGVKRQVLVQLLEEKQVGGLGAIDVAADEVRVPSLEGLCVRELRECSIGEICRTVLSRSDAKQRRSKWRERIPILDNRR